MGGASATEAQVAIGGASAGFITSDQAVALETGTPNAASTGAVLAANSVIDTAFGASPSFFAIGELGGGHSAAGTTVQTATSQIELTVDLTQLATRQDLLVGLYHGTTVGSGFTSLTFDIYADGSDMVHEVFTTVAAAVSFFTDNAINLGSLSSGALSGNTLTLEAAFSITGSSANSGFDAGLIFGDPPGGGSKEPATVGDKTHEVSPKDLAGDHLPDWSGETGHHGLGFAAPDLHGGHFI